MIPGFGGSRVFLIALLLCVAEITRAQSSGSQIVVHLDPEKTEIHWTLGTVLHTVHGTFRLKGGMMTFDRVTGAAEGEFLVDVTTGQSGNDTRDGKMQKEVLESDKYPQAFFHPLKISGDLKNGSRQNLTVDGTLNIHGIDHPLRLPIVLELNGTGATATTHFTVPYVAWKMKDESTFLLKVDKEVTVDVIGRGSIEGITEK